MAEEAKAAVYVGWQTFSNSLDALAEGVPNVIDRSAFPNQSGGVQSQLMAGLKFLALVDEAGKPTNDLYDLAVKDQVKRKETLRRVLESRYAQLFALGLDKATPSQLSDAMAKSYNVTGDTRDKALRFFLGAAQYAGVTLSRFLIKNDGTPIVRRRPVSRRPATDAGTRRAQTEPNIATAPMEQPPTSAGMSRSITLVSGGSVTLSASVDMFKLSSEDRKFLFDIIDRLANYEEGGEDEVDEENA